MLFQVIITNEVRRDYIVIVAFYPNGCSQFENPEAPDFKKIASSSRSFSTLSLPSLLPLPSSFIKVLLLPQKLNHFHRFRIPASNENCRWTLLFLVPLLSVVIAWCSKTVFWVNRNGGAQAVVRGARPPGPPVAKALMWHNSLNHEIW